MQNYAVAFVDNNTKVVPAGRLDDVLVKKDKSVETWFYEFFEGNILTDNNRKEFFEKIIDNVNQKLYPTTDHLITCVKVTDVYFVYISLDNSGRAADSGHSLKKRLPEMFKVINKILDSLERKCILCMSEACRGTDDLSWLQLRELISSECNVKFMTEKKNKETEKATGIACFYSESVTVKNYYCNQLLDGCFGSQIVGIKLSSDDIVWIVHFPIDFDHEKQQNRGFKAMTKLQNMMDTHDGSVCALGDFNLIPGCIADSVRLAIDNDKYRFMNTDTLTFFGAYFDTIPYEERKLIL